MMATYDPILTYSQSDLLKMGSILKIVLNIYHSTLNMFVIFSENNFGHNRGLLGLKYFLLCSIFYDADSKI